ncbi:bacteriohemerythrin [Methylococcus sp. EFPC2]|uniref:bacteriohemerythrin n=1 Tax=Methylococcus sp. EFPC2 TaxID=2812648 RepID=UPI0019678688|nr:bacteriohemerythrin [Methylococcus sp. EFPC2]QSA96711.1 bacteriohemerythrin [Methylococcus sp. EFPC2]
MRFDWDQKYEIGNELIDKEHQVFVELIRNVAYSIEDDAESDYIVRLLTEVEKYAEFHFLSEENIMISCRYPERERHRQLHLQLSRRLRDHIEAYQRGESEAVAVLEFLMDWFAQHTVREDLRLAEHIGRLNAHGSA